MKKRTIVIISVVLGLFAALTAGTIPFLRSNDVFSGLNAVTAETAVNFNSYMPDNPAQSAVIIDADSKNVLYSKNADKPRGMASTTKIMTALVAIENGDPDQEFVIPAEAVGIEGSSVYLKEGEPLSLRELLYCLMLESGNDAATAIAIFVGGSEENFVKMMNDRADELGLKSTNFTNPHGLSDPEHRTTAYELAVITAEAMQYPLFREITATKTLRVRYDGKENARPLVNHNKLLFNYQGAIGIKTGYTKADGRCLVSSACRDGLTLVAVTLSDPSPTSTHRILLDASFEQYEMKHIASAGELCAEIPITDSEDLFVSVANPTDISICLPRGADLRIEMSIPENIHAPIEEGEIIAVAKCYLGDTEVHIINLESTEDVKEKKKSLFDIFGK